MENIDRFIQVSVRRNNKSSALDFEAVWPKRNNLSDATASWEVQLPVWRPGRYERGEFAQFIMKLVGVNESGNEIKLDKTDLHRWAVPAGISTIKWTFQADILNAGSTCVLDDLQYVNPVNCFLYDPCREDLGYRIELTDVPDDWTVATGLPKKDGALWARDMQHVMDSPWMASPNIWHAEYSVEENNQSTEFHIWSYDSTPPQPKRFIEDHIAFSKSQISFFGSFPSPHYHFLYLLPKDKEARHGVEHEDSTVIALGPSEKIQSDYGYQELIGIASHELYHSWNVKRIRPEEWMPYNFAKTSPSKLGYIAEGVTTYMGDLFLFEANCIDLKGWCTRMEAILVRHLNNPGRNNLSVAESSYDTWLDGYRIGVYGRKGSIYVEGAVLAFLCDQRIMSVTEGKSSLSTAMTILWEKFGKPRIGITAENFWDTLAEVANERLDDLRRDYADGTKDTWKAIVKAMASNGLSITKSTNEKGLINVSIFEK